MHVWELLARAREHWPERVAVVTGGRRCSYGQLYDRAAAAARALGERGAGDGARLAVLEPNSAAFIEATFAAAGAGAVLMPLNHRLAPAELAAALADAEARWLLAAPQFADKVAAIERAGARLDGVIWSGEPPRSGDATWEALAAEPPPAAFSPRPGRSDGLAHLYYTSGTTGRPKGVQLTHDNVCIHAETTVRQLELDERDVWAHVAPMFHLADAWANLAITAVGGRHAVLERFAPEAALALLAGERVTVTNLIPTMLNLMVKHPAIADCDLSSLRLILSGGAPIAPALVRQVMQAFGCRYVQTYGMTETSPFLTLGLLPAHLEQLGEERVLAYRAKTGRPFAGVELRVVAADGRPVAADGRAVGEIQVRGPTVTPGYWRRPAEDAAAFTADGFLRTGDLATVDAEGFVDIVDRAKDMILSGGENVYSTEVENALYSHPAVLEAAAFGVPDARWGEAVRAAVVLRPDARATAAELIAHCRECLAGYKAPKRIVFMDALPKTGSGKIAKRELRRLHQPAGAEGGARVDSGGGA